MVYFEIINGKKRDGKKYDRDILCNDKLLLSLEISFQVTGNSAMEQKSHLNIGDRKVIFVFGGAGWLERSSALSRIEDIHPNGESPYFACFGCTYIELEKLKEFIIKFAEENCDLDKKQILITDFK